MDIVVFLCWGFIILFVCICFIAGLVSKIYLDSEDQMSNSIKVNYNENKYEINIPPGNVSTDIQQAGIEYEQKNGMMIPKVNDKLIGIVFHAPAHMIPHLTVDLQKVLDKYLKDKR